MTLFEFGKGLGIFFLGLEEVLVPLLVELLVLFDMSLLALFSLLRLVEDELLVPAIVILLLKLGNPILSHLSLHILPFTLTRLSVIFQYFAVTKLKLIFRTFIQIETGCLCLFVI